MTAHQAPTRLAETDARCTLVAKGVTVARGGRTILHDVSFRVDPGEALILTGPNGAGKSTLLRTLAGFLTPAAGRIALTGFQADLQIEQQVHLCGHLDGLKTQMTARENLAFWAAFLGASPAPAEIEPRIAAALDAFQLTPLAEMPAAYLSAGQKRRLGLARLLTAPRPLWLLDEPTVSLDTASLDLLLAVLRAHLAGGGLIVAATHVDLPLPGARTLRLGHAAAATVDESALS